MLLPALPRPLPFNPQALGRVLALVLIVGCRTPPVPAEPTQTAASMPVELADPAQDNCPPADDVPSPAAEFAEDCGFLPESHVGADLPMAQREHNCGVTLQQGEDYDGAYRHFVRAMEHDENYFPPQLEMARMRAEGWGMQSDVPGGIEALAELVERADERTRALAAINILLLTLHHNLPETPRLGQYARIAIAAGHSDFLPIAERYPAVEDWESRPAWAIPAPITSGVIFERFGGVWRQQHTIEVLNGYDGDEPRWETTPASSCRDIYVESDMALAELNTLAVNAHVCSPEGQIHLNADGDLLLETRPLRTRDGSVSPPCMLRLRVTGNQLHLDTAWPATCEHNTEYCSGRGTLHDFTFSRAPDSTRCDDFDLHHGRE